MLLGCATVSALGASRASAQRGSDSVSEAHVWFSAGLGTGSVNGSIAGELGFWYAGRAFAMGLQGNADDAVVGGAREAIGLLAGVSRGHGDERYLIAAGPATLHAFVCSDDGGCRNGVHDLALAFAGETSINSSIIGIGLDTFGGLDSRGGSYIALALALQLGGLKSGR